MSTFSSLGAPRVLKFLRLRAYLSSPTSQMHKTPQSPPCGSAVTPADTCLCQHSPHLASFRFHPFLIFPSHADASPSPFVSPLPSSFQSQTSVFFFFPSSVPKPQNVCHPHPPLLLFSPLSSTSHLGFSLIPAFFFFARCHHHLIITGLSIRFFFLPMACHRCHRGAFWINPETLALTRTHTHTHKYQTHKWCTHTHRHLVSGINMSFMYHYTAWGVKLLKDALLLLIFRLKRHTHTHPFSISSSSSLPLSGNNEEHKSVSDGLESIIMMKPCCNTSTRVAIVIQQRRHK